MMCPPAPPKLIHAHTCTHTHTHTHTHNWTHSKTYSEVKRKWKKRNNALKTYKVDTTEFSSCYHCVKGEAERDNEVDHQGKVQNERWVYIVAVSIDMTETRCMTTWSVSVDPRLFLVSFPGPSMVCARMCVLYLGSGNETTLLTGSLLKTVGGHSWEKSCQLSECHYLGVQVALSPSSFVWLPHL